MWLLSFLFAAMWIGVGSLVIADLPRVDDPITIEQFVDREALKRINRQETLLTAQRQQFERRVQDTRSDYKSAGADYSAAKASLENWLKTRVATQQAEQDSEVLARTGVVDELKLRQRGALRQLEAAETDLRELDRQLQDLRSQRNTMMDAARPALREARRAETLKVFLFRLALTIPLLAVAGYLIARKRKSSYWPLYRGFVLFALFAFFVELVPYLPSYGGYVRFIVGLVLLAIAGHYATRGMGRYLDRKRKEERRSEGERRKAIDYETALKKIAAKTCPGCDRAIPKPEDPQASFCVHCGIRLREKCTHCDADNISFHRFCVSCGEPTESATAPEAPGDSPARPEDIGAEGAAKA